MEGREGVTGRKEALEELRDILYGRLISSPPGAVAGIAREYRQVMEDLEALDPPKEEDDTLNELSAFRNKRQSASGH